MQQPGLKQETIPQPDVTMEGLAQTNPDLAAELEEVFKITPLETLTKETGLGLNELSQVLTIETETGIKHGSIAKAIQSPQCPAGRMVRGRYKRGGLQGVENMFNEWREDDPNINVVVTASTWHHERGRLEKTEVATSQPEPTISHDAEMLKKN